MRLEPRFRLGLHPEGFLKLTSSLNFSTLKKCFSYALLQIFTHLNAYLFGALSFFFPFTFLNKSLFPKVNQVNIEKGQLHYFLVEVAQL